MGGMRCGPREVASDRGASGVQGRARLQTGGKARGGAHVEHVAHGCNFGRIEAQRLVERRRALSRVERRAYIRCGAKCGPGGWEAAGDRGARSVQGRDRLQIGCMQGTGRIARKTCGACS